MCDSCLGRARREESDLGKFVRRKEKMDVQGCRMLSLCVCIWWNSKWVKWICNQITTQITNWSYACSLREKEGERREESNWIQLHICLDLIQMSKVVCTESSLNWKDQPNRWSFCLPVLVSTNKLERERANKWIWAAGESEILLKNKGKGETSHFDNWKWLW